MNELICKSCGGTLEFEEGQSVAVCDSCGKKQTLPRFRSDKKKNLFARASQLCRANKFDKALNCYEDALQEDAEDPEVHWMLAMCRYGVEYVEEADGKRKPTIHRIQQHSILADEDYKEALKYADDDQKSVYEAEAREIDRIHKAFMDIARNEKPFDVFICYKETDENGKRTQDSTLANELYHSLSQDGFKVFFAAITLEDKLGTDYEPYIFAALQSAKVMVVMGTKKEYFEATWVRNEWNRYLSLIESEKEQNHISKRALIPAYKDMDAYDLPEEFAHLQAMDMSKLGFMPDLIRGIRKILEAAKEKPAAQAAQPVAMDPGKPNLKNLETRMFNFCQDGDWKKAEEYAERILDNDPNNGKAYLGHLLVESGCKNVNELRNSTILLPNYRYFTNAMEKGDEQQQAMLREMTQFVTKRMEDERREAIYADGMRNLMKAKHTQDEQAAVNAMHILRKVKGWRDANERAQESEELANAIREEKQRIADERAAKAKRQKRNKLITKLVLAACGIFFIWFMVNGRRDLSLSKAKKMIRNEQYEEAYEILGKLGEYKGASALIVTNICERANAQIDAGSIDAARDLLMPYPESSEVQEVMRRVNYEYGTRALAKKDYDAAYSFLSASGSYEDADTLIAESKYTRASDAMDSGEYEEAISLMEGMENYANVAGMLMCAHYAIAETAMEEADYGKAFYNYYSAGDYEDSKEKMKAALEQYVANGDYAVYEALVYTVLAEEEDERADYLLSTDPWLEGLSDQQSLSGRVGLGTQDYTLASFDNVIVRDNITGEILYSNDFSENTLTGEIICNSEGIWTVEDEVLKDTDSEYHMFEHQPLQSVTFNTGNLSNYSFEFDATMESDNNVNIMIALTDIENCLWASYGDTFDFYRLESGEDAVRFHEDSIEVALKEGESYHFKTVSQGTHVCFYLNGSLVYSVNTAE